MAKPDHFYIGVWAQPDWIFNEKDWSKIPMFQKWTDRGIDLFVCNRVEPQTGQNSPQLYCKMAADLGAKAIIFPSDTPANDPKMPGFLGWAQPDEPEGWNHLIKKPDGTYDMDATTKLYTDRYKALKALSPNTPIYGNFTSNCQWARPDSKPPQASVKNFEDWFSGCDWLSFDQYIRNNNKAVECCFPFWRVVFDWMRVHGAAKPAFCYVEVSDYDTSSPTNGQGPTGDEFRCEVWTAIILGACGIIYFSHRIAGGFAYDAMPPDVEAEMKRITKDIRAVGDAVLLAPNKLLDNLAAPFVGCERVVGSDTYRIILNLSKNNAVLDASQYGPYAYAVFKNGKRIIPYTVTPVQRAITNVQSAVDELKSALDGL